jgi:thiamine biosynthesis lipoprotein
VEIVLEGHVDIDTLQAWITEGFKSVEEIDRLMSFYRPDSDVSRLNRATPGKWVDIHAHTRKVLDSANELHQRSGGFFDIRFRTSLPTGSFQPPPTRTFGTGGESRACKTGPWTLDLGGIAKGYAVDCAVRRLKRLSRGFRINGSVNAGGDLRVWGKPREAIAVATSAIRTPATRGRLSPASHVRMPAGRPMTQERAVTVFAESCLWSDALTKVVMLAPPQIARRCLALYQARSLASA